MISYEIVCLDLYGNSALIGDWREADCLAAGSPMEAAEKWAKRQDQKGDYWIIGRGECRVGVRVANLIEYEIFDIKAEALPVYTARKVNKTEK